MQPVYVWLESVQLAEILPILRETTGNQSTVVRLRKYATHLFTTPLSNVISDNMMSRLILTLIKQDSDNQFTNLYVKTWTFLCRMHILKDVYFVA